MPIKLRDNQSVGYAIDPETETITFLVRGFPEWTLDVDKLSNAVQQKALYIGLAQVRIVDGAAVSKTDKNGTIIPEPERLAAKYKAMKRLCEHYETGTENWELERTGGGGGKRVIGLDVILEALSRALKLTPEKIDSTLKLAVKTQGGDLEAHARRFAESTRVQTAILEILAERSGRAEIADAGLAEFEALAGAGDEDDEMPEDEEVNDEPQPE